ncbi:MULTISPECIES: HAD family hydrolase [Heyndrickxia]|uniref:HAD family hydrolase n=1 Tax=Heyndrickxia TaxID=2837504 RepID=UPI002DB938BE|nr:HAD family phosphatase [Weizmannia sp. CD-2023]MEC2224610.1 HAD family phosphatase [Weizmannia sp. CD-2023]
MIEGVIFDMDGVLIDSEVQYRHHFHEFLKTQNIDLEITTLNFIAGASPRMEDEFVAGLLNISVEKAGRLKDAYFREITIDYAQILKPYVHETLAYLASCHKRIGLASSSKMEIIRRVLETCHIVYYFHTIVSGEMFKETKPHPEIYQYTAKEMQVNVEALLAVEDSNYGVQAAKAAGIKVVAVLDPVFRFDVSLADYQVHSLKDVIGIIELEERR